MRTDLKWKEIAVCLFSIKENSLIQNIDPSLQLKIFYQCWTRKEAFLKGLGLGLSIPLNQFDVPLNLSDKEFELRIKWNGSEEQEWRLWNLPPLKFYTSALATKGTPRFIRSFDYLYSFIPHSTA
jgi:4'-phosphopantetheinyl transferase